MKKWTAGVFRVFIFLLILGGGIWAYFYFANSAAKAAWYNSSWTYRKQLAVTGTTAGAQTNYQMMLTVYKSSGTDSGSSVYLGTNVQDDFDDLRFTKSDGTTPLDYWIESYASGTSAVVWVEFDSIPASPSTINFYIYYGNTSASIASSGTNTFTFFDDFPGSSLDSSKWDTNISGGTISVSSGVCTITSGSSTWSRAQIYSKLEYSTNTRTRGLVQHSEVTMNHDFGLRKRSEIPSTWSNVIRIGSNGSSTFYAGTMSSGVESSSDITTWNSNWNTQELDRNGTSSILYSVGSNQTTISTNVMAVAGAVWARAEAGSSAGVRTMKIDWVFVGSYVSPEPTFTSWGSQETETGSAQIPQTISDLQKGLVAWWKMDGNAKDSSAYLNHGTVTGAALTPDRKGQANRAYNFNGSSDYMNVGNGTSLNISNKFTISYWYKQIASSWGGTMSKPSYSSGFDLAMTTGYINLRSSGFSTTDNYCATGISNNTWAHLAITYDESLGGDNLLFYINGVLKCNLARTGGLRTNTSVLNIAKYVDGDVGWWGGSINDIRIYNRAITSSEVVALYQEYVPAAVAVSNLQRGLVGQWKMDGNAKDSSSYANHGTVTGASLIEDRKGQTNKAYNFDGSDDVITVADNSSLDLTSQVTIGGWVYDPPLTAEALQNEKDSLSKQIFDRLSSLFNKTKSFLGFNAQKKSPYDTEEKRQEFYQNLSQAPIGTKKLISPYNEVKNLGGGKFSSEISTLPMSKADLSPIDPSWHKDVFGGYVVGDNLFKAKINGVKTTLMADNDQPIFAKNSKEKIKQGDYVVFIPVLKVGGKEYKPRGDPKLLAVDPLNKNYKNNTLEWNYGIAIRRLRVIEGSFQGSWIFKEDPKADVSIKYNQKGKIALNLGGSSTAIEQGTTPMKVLVRNNDEEFIPKQQFSNLAMKQYPVAIADSSTFYPDAHTETTSVDGYAARSSVDETWSAIKGGAGTLADASITTASLFYLQGSNTTNQYRFFSRSIFLFDTSSLNDNATITGVTLSIFMSGGKQNSLNLSPLPTINIYSSAPASNTSITASDFSSLGTTPYSTGIGYDSWTYGYKTFTFNSNGINAIAKTGITKLGARDETYDIGSSSPAWASGSVMTYIGAYSSDNGVGYKPELVVTYTLPLPAVIIGKGRDAYSLEIDSGLNVSGWINGNQSSSTQITKAWHHVVMTYDGANIKLYVDGVLKTTTAKTGAIGTNSTALSMASSMAGKLDDMRIYNTALTQNEITSWYEEYGGGIAVSDLQKGLVGHWKMDGNAKDASAYSNHGTVTGATLTTDRKGQVNKAYSFNGTSNYIDAGNRASLQITGPITISAWVYYNNVGGSMVNKYDATGGQRGYYVDIYPGNLVRFAISQTLTPFSGAIIYSNTALVSNRWYHIVCVFSPNTRQEIYINGIADYTPGGAATSIANPARDLAIGAGYDNNVVPNANYHNGLIDDVRIYNRALSAAEVLALYQSY